MRLSIHFSGRLRIAEDLPALIAEVKDVSNISGWKYHIFETRFPNDCFEDKTLFDDVYGICFSPPKCEPVFFTFLFSHRKRRRYCILLLTLNDTC